MVDLFQRWLLGKSWEVMFKPTPKGLEELSLVKNSEERLPDRKTWYEEWFCARRMCHIQGTEGVPRDIE